jgi:non-specific serine/threonine protein kinase
VLATSREPLGLPGEVERPVPPLDRPAPDALESLERLAAYDAVRLLVERGADVRPGFRLTDGNAAALARICSKLAGLPLAIELAAARLRTLSPEQVADRLREQLDLLTQGGRNRPNRHQTMRATLDWSNQLLAADERIVFRRLSVFAGGFTLDAAEQVVDRDGMDRAGVAGAVERLASKSLVAIDHDRDEPRLHMLEPVRQYAAEQLRESGERDRVVRQHLEWVESLAAKAGSEFMREQRRLSARLRDEQDNIRQAMESALTGVDGEAALRIAAMLAYAWNTMAQPDARAWVLRALAAAPGAPDLIRAVALFGAGLLAENALDYDQALVHQRNALAISRAVGARVLEGSALMGIGRIAWGIDVDARLPTAWFEDALRIFREIDEPVGIGWTLVFLAEEQLKAGDLEGAASRATEASDVGSRSGLLQVVAGSRRVLAVIAIKRSQYADAKRLLEEAAAAYEQADDRWQHAVILTMTAHLAFDRGDDDPALGPLREALRLARGSGSSAWMAHAITLAIDVLHRRGRAGEVATLVGALEVLNDRFPRAEETLRSLVLGWTSGGIQSARGTGIQPFARLVSAGCDEHRVAGRSLSLERATDLALRVVDEELAAASAAEGREGGGAAGRANTPRRQGR